MQRVGTTSIVKFQIVEVLSGVSHFTVKNDSTQGFFAGPIEEDRMRMRPIRTCKESVGGWAVALSLVVTFMPAILRAQDKLKTEPEIIVFKNGEKLIGHFEGFIGGSAKFKSDTLGEVSVDLKAIQEFHTTERFAVIRKDLKLGKGKIDGQIPRGPISVADQNVEIAPDNNEPARTVAVGDLGTIIDEASFNRALHRPGIFEAWKGGVTFGTSIVEATQNSLSFNTNVNLVRAIPSESWLPARNRTTIDFSDSYGKVTQPDTPTVKTSIYHADAERDEYFTSNVYAFGSVAFDHNFSQGLDLQQSYGGGVGWTVIQASTQTLDLKGSANFEKQAFEPPTGSQNLANSIFTETYSRRFSHGIVLKEQAAANPAWTNTRAYSSYASVGVTFPVYKRFGFNTNIIDSFLNDPPPGFKKNSIQFTTGIAYTLP
jgi:hypothetical protein